MSTKDNDASASSAGKRTKGQQRTTPLGDALLDFAELDSDRVQILRYDRTSSSYNHAGSYENAAPRAVGLSEFCRLRGGGGKYRARIKRNDGTYGPSTTIIVEGTPRTWAEPTNELGGVTTDAGGAVAAPGLAGTFERFLGPFMAAAGTAIGTLLIKKLLDEPKVDPLMLELVKRNGAGAGVDPLELQNAIAAAEARGEARGRELGRLTEISTREPENNTGVGGAIGALERGLPAVLDVVNRHLTIEESKVTPRQLAPANGAPAQPAAPADPLAQLLLTVPIAARKFLHRAATNDGQAEVYAAMILENLDDVSAARMRELLPREDFADVLVATWPAFQDFRPWVDGLVVALRDLAGGDEEEGDDVADVDADDEPGDSAVAS